MINKTHPIARQLILTAIEQTEQLHQLLSKEAIALQSKTKIDELNAITLEKNKTVSQLSIFSKQIEQILSAEKLDPTTGMSEYFTRAEQAGIDTTESSRNWEKMLSLSKKCRQLNEQNGASIQILNQHTQRILDVLKGKPQEIDTYSKKGQAKNASVSHTFTSV